MKKINKPRIIERLRSRFDLTDMEAETFRLLENIVLVTNVDNLLAEWKCKVVGDFSRTAVAGAGFMVAYTVPSGKRYTIRAIEIVSAGGDGTIGNMYVNKDIYILIMSQTPAVNLATKILEQDIVLDEDMSIVVQITAISTDSSWAMRFYYSEEDAF